MVVNWPGFITTTVVIFWWSRSRHVCVPGAGVCSCDLVLRGSSPGDLTVGRISLSPLRWWVQTRNLDSIKKKKKPGLEASKQECASKCPMCLGTGCTRVGSRARVEKRGACGVGCLCPHRIKHYGLGWAGLGRAGTLLLY